MTTRYLFAGFGGQGILFAGKFAAYKGLMEDRQVSWLPSYGPEMRGGTASCSVIVSDEPVGSPIVSHPDVLIAMNLPSFDKYEQAVVPGGRIFLDSTLVERPPVRSDVTVTAIPASVLKAMGEFGEDGVLAALKKVVSAKHADMLDANLKALKLGAEY